jgi:hypothetical protein
MSWFKPRPPEYRLVSFYTIGLRNRKIVYRIEIYGMSIDEMGWYPVEDFDTEEAARVALQEYRDGKRDGKVIG